MAAPLAALASLVLLLAAPAAAGGAEAAGTEVACPTAAAVSAAAPAFAHPAGHPGTAAAAPAGGLDHAAFTAPTPTDGSGWLLQPAPPAAAPALDLHRPRLVAAAVPEAPHPSLGRHRRADRGARLFDLHLLRMTKDRGS